VKPISNGTWTERKPVFSGKKAKCIPKDTVLDIYYCVQKEAEFFK
jgi:hypothetical protein